jgi:hypothetical protein
VGDLLEDLGLVPESSKDRAPIHQQFFNLRYECPFNVRGKPLFKKALKKFPADATPLNLFLSLSLETTYFGPQK